MKAILPIAALLVAVAPRALAGTTVDGWSARDGEVRGVSVLPASGKVEIVIDLQGAAVVQDFTLSNPARLVIDLQLQLRQPRLVGGIRGDVIRRIIKRFHLGDRQTTEENR